MFTVKNIFELGIKMGLAADPRGARGVKKYLDRIKEEYQELKPSDKEYFDVEKLTNPYLDSFIHVDDGATNVKRVLAGIDINSADIILASQLNERGKTVDAVIAHHPVGRALAYLHEVMEMQVDIFHSLGVPVHLAEKIMEERIKEVGRGIHHINHYQTVNVAQILQINFLNTHTITDNLVNEFLTNYLANKKPDRISDVIKALMEIPEYKIAKRLGSGPKIFSGSPGHRVGKFLVDMTGGTEPSSKVYQEISRSGVSTIVGMHMREQSMEKANEYQLNIVVAGHISSDSLGMNLFLDELEKKGIEVVPCGGLIRVSRVGKKK